MCPRADRNDVGPRRVTKTTRRADAESELLVVIYRQQILTVMIAPVFADDWMVPIIERVQVNPRFQRNRIGRVKVPSRRIVAHDEVIAGPVESKRLTYLTRSE